MATPAANGVHEDAMAEVAKLSLDDCAALLSQILKADPLLAKEVLMAPEVAPPADEVRRAELEAAAEQYADRGVTGMISNASALKALSPEAAFLEKAKFTPLRL